MENKTLQLLCCLERTLGNLTAADVNSMTHLYLIAKPCFNQNATMLDVLAFLLGDYESKHKDFRCSKKEDAVPLNHCTASTTVANITYIFFWTIIMAAGIFGNLFVCIAMNKVHLLRENPANRFLVSLAVSDLFIAVFLVPIKIKFTSNNQYFCGDTELCRFYITVDTIIFTASVANLVIIAMDRYLALTRPYKYVAIVNEKKSKIAIVTVWCIAALVGILTNFNWDDLSTEGIIITDTKLCGVNNCWYTIVVFTIFLGIPMVIMGFVYTTVFKIAIKHAHQIVSIEAQQWADEDQEKAKNKKTVSRILKDFKVVKTIVAVYFTFLVCWLPVTTITIVRAWCINCVVLTPWQYSLFNEILPFLHSTLNFFIYFLTNPQFRKAFNKLICRDFLGRHDFNGSMTMSALSLRNIIPVDSWGITNYRSDQ